MFINPMAPLGELSGFKTERTNTQTQASELPFKEIFSTAIKNLQETELLSNNDTALIAMGEIDDLHTLGINAMKAYLAERLVVELRNRAMDAYSELMRINL